MIERTARDVESRAKAALLTSPVPAVRTLCVERHGRTLTLSGRVTSFYLKQLAQEAILEIAGELQVVNSVDVD